MFRHIIILLLALTVCTTAGAQNAETLYKEGRELYEAKKYSEAFPKLQTAAKKGHKKAQYWLARCYDKGRGVTEDNRQAFQWYLKAAQQGHAKSQYQLARCYVKGKGVAADTAEARKWIRRAVRGKKHGQEITDDIKKAAAEGSDTAKTLLQLLK